MAHPLIQRRDEVVDRADRAVQAAWPRRQGEPYVRQMRGAIEELEGIASAMATAGIDPVQRARTYRQLGSLYADLEPALGQQMLLHAKVDYELAEGLLQGQHDDLERAKLDFNYANALRQMPGMDVPQLQDARRRLLSARAAFLRMAPPLVAQADLALRAVEARIAIAPINAAIERNREDMEAVQRDIAAGANPADTLKKLRESMNRDGGIAGLAARAKDVVEGLPPELKTPEQAARLQEQLAALSKATLGSAPADSREAELLSLLRKRVEAEAGAGKLKGEEAESVRAVLGRLGSVLSRGDDLEDLVAKRDQMQALTDSFVEMQHYLSHGVARPPEGTRAAELVELCWALRRFLSLEAKRPGHAPEESKELLELGMRGSSIDERIYRAGADDARALAVELEELRPFAEAVRKFSARHQPMIARPIWSVAKVPPSPRALFYSGPGQGLGILPGVCRRRGLDVLAPPTGESYASARWLQLQKAATAVFDLRAPPGLELFTVTYELGVALAIGKPIVVVVSPGQRMPFDVDVVPVPVAGAPGDEAALGAAIDQSLVWVHAKAMAGSARVTLEHALAQHPRPQADVQVDQTLKMLEALRERPDPVAANRVLGTLIDFLDDGQSMLLYPRWPPAYPGVQERRLFHVMPFRPAWAKPVSEAARAAMEGKGRYIRGDEVKDPNVIRSIWEEIARASHVLVDLTGLNANVALELGIAHTLGREVQMVSQDDPAQIAFRSIDKLRIAPYDLADLEGTFGQTMEVFLAAAH